MKKLLSCGKTAIALLVIAVISLGFYVYMLARPISYEMGYRNVTEYEGGTFEGTITFAQDDQMRNQNTNFDEVLESYYYYKDGYVFFTMAGTREEYEEEVAWINDNFSEAIVMPFYADKINAFTLVAEEDDGFKTVYTCRPAIVFAIAVGVVELVVLGFTCVSIILWKKTKDENKKQGENV